MSPSRLLRPACRYFHNQIGDGLPSQDPHDRIFPAGEAVAVAQAERKARGIFVCRGAQTLQLADTVHGKRCIICPEDAATEVHEDHTCGQPADQLFKMKECVAGQNAGKRLGHALQAQRSGRLFLYDGMLTIELYQYL
jgi:hypothetical protein